jgi:hypothetical protein
LAAAACGLDWHPDSPHVTRSPRPRRHWNATMKSETQAIVSEIEQSLALLRGRL